MRIGFSLPLRAIIYFLITVVLILASLDLFQGLRIIHCPEWNVLPAPPVTDFTLAGALRDQLYIQSNDHAAVYQYEQNHWSRSSLAFYLDQPNPVPVWLKSNWITLPETSGLRQIIRAGKLNVFTYYMLQNNGTLRTCSTDFEKEVNAITQSGAIALFLFPLGGMIFCGFRIFTIFAHEGNITYWDFWGNGTRLR